MSKELDVAIEAAKKAGRLQLEKLFSKHELKEKGPKDFVTDVDLESEKIIINHIRENFPSHSFLSEESGKSKNSSQSKWIIDPVDGTHSYMRGLPNFGISIALEKEGQIIAGVIFLPVFGELLSAEKGKGAFLNGKKIFVSKNAGLEGTNGSFEFDSCYKSLEEYAKLFGKIFAKMLSMRSLGGVVDYAMVATGRTDFCAHVQCYPWDVAAASLIISEAGGKLTSFKGKPAPYISNIVASNGLLHEKILKELGK